jgi:hypothetical protein
VPVARKVILAVRLVESATAVGVPFSLASGMIIDRLPP